MSLYTTIRAVADRDASRFLPAVLQCVEPVVGELGDLLAGSPDAEDAARVLRRPIPRIEVAGQSAIGLDHAVSLNARATISAHPEHGQIRGQVGPDAAGLHQPGGHRVGP